MFIEKIVGDLGDKRRWRQYKAAFGLMRRHARHSTAPTPADCDHVVGFCTRGLSRDERTDRG